MTPARLTPGPCWLFQRPPRPALDLGGALRARGAHGHLPQKLLPLPWGQHLVRGDHGHGLWIHHPLGLGLGPQLQCLVLGPQLLQVGRQLQGVVLGLQLLQLGLQIVGPRGGARLRAGLRSCPRDGALLGRIVGCPPRRILGRLLGRLLLVGRARRCAILADVGQRLLLASSLLRLHTWHGQAPLHGGTRGALCSHVLLGRRGLQIGCVLRSGLRGSVRGRALHDPAHEPVAIPPGGKGRTLPNGPNNH
mmetsp:Transcript_24947/g.69765  ORF Transcript_24947/g.69765 Transcript_24947/m.69765 type:complete len:249 (-) Transcript_24947:1100-1846(-)